MSAKLNTRARNNLILFSLSFIYIFILGLFEGLFRLDFVYYTFISAIIIFSILTVRHEKKKGGSSFIIPIILVISTWVTEVMEFKLFSTITGYVATLFFLPRSWRLWQGNAIKKEAAKRSDSTLGSSKASKTVSKIPLAWKQRKKLAYRLSSQIRTHQRSRCSPPTIFWINRFESWSF